MKNQVRVKILSLALLAVVVLFAPAARLFAGDNEIEFKGQITQIESTSSMAAKLTVALSAPSDSGPQTTVLVDELTRISGPGDVSLTIADLSVGQFIEVRGVFTTAGIYARKLEVEAGAETQNEFRIRGTIDGVSSGADAVTFTVGGVPIVANSATRLKSRGGSSALTLSDLAVGQLVDVKGLIQNAQLIATRIEVGPKLQDQTELEFHGTVTAINGDDITIEIAHQPAVTVVVKKNEETRIQGVLAVGVDVEVKAMMARDFTIVASKIEVAGAAEAEHRSRTGNGSDSNGSGGNGSGDNGGSGHGNGGTPPQNVKREIQLHPTEAAPLHAEGEAEVEFETHEGTLEQKFEAQGEKLKPNESYSVRVSFGGDFVSLGSFTTNQEGEGKLKLRCGATCTGFPSDKDVRNIAAVQIVNTANAVVLQGSF